MSEDRPRGGWLTDRDRWRRRIASAALVVGVALIVWWLSPKRDALPVPSAATRSAVE